MPLEHVWLAPVILTTIFFGIAAYICRDDEVKTHPAYRLINLFIYCIALCLSLISWLVWAVLV